MTFPTRTPWNYTRIEASILFSSYFKTRCFTCCYKDRSHNRTLQEIACCSRVSGHLIASEWDLFTLRFYLNLKNSVYIYSTLWLQAVVSAWNATMKEWKMEYFIQEYFFSRLTKCRSVKGGFLWFFFNRIRFKLPTTWERWLSPLNISFPQLSSKMYFEFT